MRRSVALLAGTSLTATLVVAAPTAQQPPADDASQPVFRADVAVVSLNVTVTDKSGRYIQGLEQSDFSVFEDGVKQDVIFFSGAQLPTALALLIDTSASMNERMATAQEAAIGFVSRMQEGDLATVIDFDSRAEILQTFTSSKDDLVAAIRRTTAGGSTSLYNAIYIALNEFRRMRAASDEDVRRQAIVVLSDGEDTSSLVAFDEVLELAKRTEVAIYAIGLRDSDNRSRGLGGGFRESEFVLKQFAQETGGRAFFPISAGELADIYGQVADELAAQYTLGYAPRNTRRDGTWRRIVVRVERPDALARTKQGYYAPTASP